MKLSIHLLVALVVGIITSIIAKRRGRNQYLWFGIGFLFGILGLLAIFIAPLPKKKIENLETSIPVLQPFIDGPIDRFWYYLDDARKQQGPMSHNALTKAWKSGQVHLSTLVWHEDLPNWKELRDLIKNLYRDTEPNCKS